MSEEAKEAGGSVTPLSETADPAGESALRDGTGASTPEPVGAAPATAADAESLFESASREENAALQVALGSYEGPLDLLLDLARRQKVDLREISVLALAEQYLRFIAEAKRLRLDIAAEYLVMAAWLAYLKSRLLLPKPPDDAEPSGEEMAAHLAFQLERLEAMRSAARELFALPQLGAQFWPRGEPERRVVTSRVAWEANLRDLLLAYTRQRTKENFQPLHLERRSVVAIDDALVRLRAVLGDMPDWELLESFLPDEWRDDAHARSALASTFAATLELAKLGQVRIRQDGVFAPIYVSRRDRAAEEREKGRSEREEAAKRRRAEPSRRGSAA